MIGLMMYWLVMGTLLTVAAEALHRAAGVRRWPSRFIWVGALTATLVGPFFFLLLPPPVAPIRVAMDPIDYTHAVDALVGGQASSPAISRDLILLLLWALASTGLLVYGSVAMRNLRRARRQWAEAGSGEDVVLISDDMGPAVVGILDPAIVVPRWFDGLSESQQRLILAHEREHIAAEDPILIMWSQVMPALLPWNPAVWLQAKRLREAVELDCDARLLARGTNASRYAELLLDVGH